MKNTIKVIFTLLLTSYSTLTFGSDDQMARAKDSNQNRVVIKVDREFIGGRLEVLSAAGHQVTAQRVIRRKLIVDFCDVKTGIYTIVIKKDDRTRKSEFVKK
jgi:hypothetical protein